MKRFALSSMLVLLAASVAQAADIFPVKAYSKPGEPVLVKFVNGKGDEAKKAVAELGAAAAKLDLFTPAQPSDIVSNGAPLFKVYDASGKDITAGATKAATDNTFDLAEVAHAIRDGGTYYVTWKDATPLVVQTLFNPGRGPKELERIKSKLELLSDAERKQVMEQYAPIGVHMELAEIAVITTDKGVIKAKFAYDVAPHTIDNFTSLARQGFYDNSAFHRIIAGFMIQGGDSYANTDSQAGMGGPGYQIMHEFSEKKHLPGVLSMARSSEIDSAGSQFFIMHGPNANLDGQYSAFGDVFEGMDVVNNLAKTPSEQGSGSVKKDIRPKIVSVKILPATAEIYGLGKK